jgi:predicted membrane protein
MGISDWFEDMDGQKIGISLILWAVCLLVIWKMQFIQSTFMTTSIKIIISIIMLPIIYLILYFMGDN